MADGINQIATRIVRDTTREKNPAAVALGGLSFAKPSPQPTGLKYIAFYLPQFYPIPENNAWWGNGFTEWTNVTKAQPQFPGHYQPHLPADFGFYDLRVREVQHEQIVQAKRFGIDAFCFHYYWFAGRRLLERPLEEFLNDEKADIEFCLCWANENWTRGWDGAEHEVLMEQTYLPSDDIAFLESVLPYFRDPRYLRVNGAPVLLLYRVQHMPNAAETAVRWREHCRDLGIGEIHLVAALTHGNRDFEQFGFDAGVEFPPHNLPPVVNLREAVRAAKTFVGHITHYEEIARALIGENYENRRVYRGVFPSWDNTARRGEGAFVAWGATPAAYERWLGAASHLTSLERAPTERLVFINAWNEWAEGCHLEPDQKHGFAFLEATARAKSQRPAIDSTVEGLSGSTLNACGL